MADTSTSNDFQKKVFKEASDDIKNISAIVKS